MLFFQKPAQVYLKEQQKRRKLNREIYSIVPDQFRHPAGPSPTLSSVNSAQRPSCDRPVQTRRQEKSHKSPGATWNIVLEGGWCRGSIGRAVELKHWSKIDLICAYVTCSPWLKYVTTYICMSKMYQSARWTCSSYLNNILSDGIGYCVYEELT